MTNIRPLTAKEETTIAYYCDPTSETFNNWVKSYARSGYSTCRNYEANARRVRTKDAVEAGIVAYKAKIENKTARTVQSVDAMYAEMYNLAKKLNQPSAGVSACTGIARLYGMDKDNAINEQAPEPLTAEEMADLKRQAIKLTNKQA